LEENIPTLHKGKKTKNTEISPRGGKKTNQDKVRARGGGNARGVVSCEGKGGGKGGGKNGKGGSVNEGNQKIPLRKRGKTVRHSPPEKVQKPVHLMR